MSIPENKRTVPGHCVENINFLIVEPQQNKDWAEWTSDQTRAGIGAGLQNLVAGIIIGLGQALIQNGIEKIRGASPNSEQKMPETKREPDIETQKIPDIETQKIKIAILSKDSETLLYPNGNVREAVWKVLATLQQEEPNNYPIYLTNSAVCQNERLKQIRMEKSLGENPTKFARILVDDSEQGIENRKNYVKTAAQYQTIAKVGMLVSSVLTFIGFILNLSVPISSMLTAVGGIGFIVARDISLIGKNVKTLMDSELSDREKEVASNSYLNTIKKGTLFLGNLYNNHIRNDLY